jgi:hypothetical protein
VLRGDDGGGDESETQAISAALAAPPRFSASLRARVGSTAATAASANGERSVDRLALPPASDGAASTGACAAGVDARLGENPNQLETVLSKDAAVAPRDGLELEALV